MLSVHEHAVSKIEETNKMEELFRAIGQNLAKSEKGNEIADRREFWRSLGERAGRLGHRKILEESVDD